MPAHTHPPPRRTTAPSRKHVAKRQTTLSLLLMLLMAGIPAVSRAYTVSISSTTKSLYLQVGQGAITGGSNVSGGATPANNAAVDIVSVTVPVTSLGTGASQSMTSNVPVTISYIDGVGYCSAADTYIGGMYRGPNSGSSSATLTATTPAGGLVNGSGDTISFSTISWLTQSRAGDSAGNTLASSSFTGNGTTQTIWSIARNTWGESCLQFRYANTQVLPAGTYTGRVIYTLTAP